MRSLLRFSLLTALGAILAPAAVSHAVAPAPTFPLLVADYNGRGLFKYTSAAVGTRLGTLGGALSAVANDAAGNTYVCAETSTAIYKVTSTGTASVYATGITGGCFGLLFGADGVTLYATDIGTGRLLRVNADRTLTVLATGLAGPMQPAWDKDGVSILVPEFDADRVSRVSPAGVVTTVRSGDVWNPTAVRVGPDSLIYVSQFGRGEVSRLATNGTPSRVALITSASGLDFHPDGRLFVGQLGGKIYSVNTTTGAVTAFTSVNTDPVAVRFTQYYTTTDLCAGVVCPGVDTCHTATCNPFTGICNAAVAKADGASCNDGNGCTQTDTCQAGACVGSNPVVCSAVDACHTAGTCDPATGACSQPPAPAGTACGSLPSGACAAAPTCDGAGACQNRYLSAGTVCRSSAGPCDVAEACDGVHADCPTDAFQATSVVCRPSTGACDPAERCSGADAACPADVQLTPPTVTLASSPAGFAVPEGGSLEVSAGAAGASGAYTYAWSGVSASAGDTASYAGVDGPAVATVQVTVADAQLPACATSVTQEVTVLNAPPTVTLQAAATNSYLEGSQLTVTSLVSDPAAADAASLTYAWSVIRDGAPYAGAIPVASAGCDFPGCFAFAPNDNGAYTVTLTVTDKDGGVGQASVAVTVADVAPTASLEQSGLVLEGTPATFHLSALADVSSVDVASGLRFAHSCAGAPLSEYDYATASTSPAFTCTFADGPSEQVVTARVFDKDGLSTLLTLPVTVANAAPSLSLSTTPTEEGASTTITATFTDPGGAGDAHVCVVHFGDGASATGTVTWDGAGATCAASHVYVDDGAYTVTVSVVDKDGATSARSATQVVQNVAPRADLVTSAAHVGEGATYTVSLLNASDPGLNDTLTFALDCGDGGGYGAFTSATTRSCAAGDDEARTVRGKVRDKDGAVTEYSASLSIDEVPPTATFTGPTSVNEGAGATFSFAGAYDPSASDTAAGFRYAYDCEGGSLDGATFAAASATPTATCTFDDGPSQHLVRGRVLNEDGAFSEYTATVSVQNVAPIAVLTASSGGHSDDEKTWGPADDLRLRSDPQRLGRGCHGAVGTPVLLTFSSPYDPSAADTAAGFRYAFSCTGGAITATYATASPDPTTTCTFRTNGFLSVKGRIYDKNGGFTEYTAPVNIGGRMTGAGFRNRAQFNMELPCDLHRSYRLNLNYTGGVFDLIDLARVQCTYDPSAGPLQPLSYFNTISGSGSGKLSGRAGYVVNFTFVDGSPDHQQDRVRLTLTSPSGTLVLSLSGTLEAGNLRAWNN